jgi:hypothetical protein
MASLSGGVAITGVGKESLLENNNYLGAAPWFFGNDF